MAALTVEALVDAGAHIGCRVNRWNPKMEPYIYGTRNRIHIIDVRQTIRGILRARHFIREIIGTGQDVLFVGTKSQIREEIQKVHQATGMPYVDDRWIGGTLTNYEIIGSRIAYLEDLEAKEKEGYLEKLSGKAAARFMREKRKVYRNLHGIRDMFRLPGAMVVVDPRMERNAVLEARKMGIPVVGIVDTDGNPDTCEIVIPANDDAIRSVAAILEQLQEAVEEGLRLRRERGVEPRRKGAETARPAAPTPRPGRPGRGGRGDRRIGAGPTARRVPIQPMDPERTSVPTPRPRAASETGPGGVAKAVPEQEPPVPPAPAKEEKTGQDDGDAARGAPSGEGGA